MSAISTVCLQSECRIHSIEFDRIEMNFTIKLFQLLIEPWMNTREAVATWQRCRRNCFTTTRSYRDTADDVAAQLVSNRNKHTFGKKRRGKIKKEDVSVEFQFSSMAAGRTGHWSINILKNRLLVVKSCKVGADIGAIDGAHRHGISVKCGLRMKD